ncbi:MAG: hypothetical protein H7Z72_02570 [Bacteroidetes bacterium]|nr:hypothetical protein [Fibrella sp.]
MNQPIIYGILCEDRAHKNFVEHYLSQCYAGIFQESQEFGWTIKATNAREVDDSIPDATRLGFTKFGLDVLFVGRDSDTTQEKKISDLKETLVLSCRNHQKVLFMVPVQCIEHWLLYLQWHRENPALTKNETLEPIMRTEAKLRVYGGKLRAEKQLEIASQLLADFDVDWLASRSESFKHFHQQVRVFVSKL